MVKNLQLSASAEWSRKVLCKLFRFITALMVTCLITSQVKAQCQLNGNYTINSGLPTSGANFQSFTDAVTALVTCGVSGHVTFSVTNTTSPYTGQLNIPAIAGAGPASTITFNCNSAVLQFTSSNSLQRAGVKLDGADYIRFYGLTVQPMATMGQLEYGFGFHLINDADNNEISNCIVTVNPSSYPQNTAGIVINAAHDLAQSRGPSNCDSNLFQNNAITGCYDGIVVIGNNNVNMIHNNRILNNSLTNITNWGITLNGNDSVIVEGNDISNPAAGLVSTAIMIDEINYKVNVLRNRIHNVAGVGAPPDAFRGIWIFSCISSATNRNRIANNLFYNINSTGEQNGILLAGSTYFDIYHNTILMDDASSSASDYTRGIFLEGVVSNIRCMNNIVAISRGGSGSKHAFYIGSTASSSLTSDRNDLYVSSTSGTNAVGYFGSTRTTLANWQAAAGLDFSSASVDPVFSAPGVYLPTAAAIDNFGSHVGISTDITGAARSLTTPDIGAYEFNSSPCSTPIIPGTTTVLPGTTVCANSPLTLNLSGNSVGMGQTYQWQTATTAAGTYSNIGGANAAAAYIYYPAATLFFRAEISCGSATAYSDPVEVVATPQLPGGTYTINAAFPTGSGNYHSFNDALTAMLCGITGPVVFDVVAQSGPYNEQLILPAINGASAVNTVTFKGNGNTITYLSTNTNQRAVIKLDNADYITLDSLNIIVTPTGASNEQGFGIHLINDADNNIIRSCTIDVGSTSNATRFAGIAVSSSASDAIGGSTASRCDYNLITNNNITGGYYGITLWSWPSAGLIKGNKVINNRIYDSYSYGMYIAGTDSALIDRNDISRPARTNSTTYYGIYTDRQSDNLRISNNRIHNTFGGNPNGTNASHGIYANSSDATLATVNIISNNLIYDFGGTGNQFGLYNNGSDYYRYYHNTISFDNMSLTPTSTTRGIYLTGTVAGIEVLNNNVYITRITSGNCHGIYQNSASVAYTANYNNYYINSSAGTNYIGYAPSNSFSNLTAWYNATLQDQNSKALNPSFVSPLTGDFMPANPALDNAATPTVITLDINNMMRNAVPDIGAYEFGPSLTVDLIWFNAVKFDNDVSVEWITASEKNVAGFTIERSINGKEFTAIGSQPSAGNTSVRRAYNYIDKDIVRLTDVEQIYYRLRIDNLNGTTEYSRTAVITRNGAAELQVLPNPFDKDLFVSDHTTSESKAYVSIHDITGKLVLSQYIHLLPGTSNYQVHGVAELNAGLYFITVESDSRRQLFKAMKR